MKRTSTTYHGYLFAVDPDSFTMEPGKPASIDAVWYYRDPANGKLATHIGRLVANKRRKPADYQEFLSDLRRQSALMEIDAKWTGIRYTSKDEETDMEHAQRELILKAMHQHYPAVPGNRWNAWWIFE